MLAFDAQQRILARKSEQRRVHQIQLRRTLFGSIFLT